MMNSSPLLGNDTFQLSYHCPGPFWDYDDMDRCHRQLYFECYLVVVAMVACVLYWGWCLRSELLSAPGGPEGTDQLVFSPPGATDPSALIRLRTRTFGDKMRLLLELAINSLVVVVTAALAMKNDYLSRYVFAPKAPYIAVGLSVYMWMLSVYRYTRAGQRTPLVGSPFGQLAFLYSLVLTVSLINWFSQINRPAEDPVIRHAMWTLLGLALINWTILFSSPVGDALPRLYVARDNDRDATRYNDPSPEPESSLLRIILNSWTGEHILRARHKLLRFDDVMHLEERDHSYFLVDRFSHLPATWGFFSRVAWTLKTPLLLNVMFGVLNALLKLTPTVFIQKILVYLETRNVPPSVAWLYVFMMTFSYLVQDITLNLAFFQGRKLSIGIRALVISSVFRKALFKQVSKGDSKSAPHDANDDPVSLSEVRTGPESDVPGFDSSNTGTILNLMSVDSKKLSEYLAYLHDVPSTPILLFLSVFFLYNVLGWSAFVAVLIMVASVPFNMLMGAKISQAQEELMAVTDLRVEKTNEILDAIRIIKCYAWERRLGDKVFKIRDEELQLLIRRVKFWLLNNLALLMMPILVVIGSFWCYVSIQGGNLTTSVAFTALSVFNILRMPLMEVSETFLGASSAYISGKRISRFLESSETEKYHQLESSFGGREYIGFRNNATFSWEAPNSADYEGAFKLRDLNINFILEDLTVIVGPTGSGKTSLLMALLGEMHLESGNVYLPNGDRRIAPVDPATNLSNSVAYVPQEAWLLNDTIKRNIVFAHNFDRKRYDAVLDACELRRDLDILEQGDQTLIGDKGIALSGGQKQRVSLARALYSNSRHLLLDDCLSAVDSHTAVALYNNALNGPLARFRTVILVSHNVALTVKMAGHVVVMDNGRIVAQGTPADVAISGHLGNDELVSRNAQSAVASRTASQATSRANTVEPEEPRLQHMERPQHSPHSDRQHEFSDVRDLLLPTLEFPLPENEEGTTGATNHDDLHDAMRDVKHNDEEMAEGAIALSTYIAFIRKLGSPLEIFFAAFPVIAVSYSDFLLSLWVREWAAHMGSDEYDAILSGLMYLAKHVQSLVIPMKDTSIEHMEGIYTFGNGSVTHETLSALRFYSLGYLAIGVVVTLLSIFRDYIVVWGTVRASRKIFRELLTKVMHARTRFFDTTPSGRIVNRFSQDMVILDQEIGPELSWFAISCVDALRVAIVVSWVTPLLIPVALMVMILFLYIGQAYLSAARELQRMESVTISPIFQQFSESVSGSVIIRAYGDTQRFMATNMNAVDNANRPYLWLWIANRWLAFWCATLSLSICSFAAAFIVMDADHIDPGMAGVSLSLSTSFGGAVLWSVRMYAMCEISMNSVERVHEYLDVEQEAPSIIPESRPPEKWPSRGSVEFKNLSLQYTEDLPMVIKNVSFKVGPGQKVGIVGRTGAGKSTIITALFRLLEPATGSIIIDELDISTIGLEDLRSRLSIIPQDPTLFKGTLRSNLDLFSEYSDENLFRALSYVNLVPESTTPHSAAETLSSDTSMENTNQFLDLEMTITEGGHNLSQGQRQLICLARAILKDPRILLLDEATASIDYNTDSIIQDTIRKQFTHTTILTIAHRLRTIADYDMILVLEHGQVAQFAHPYDLLLDTSGLFYSMCSKSGELDVLIDVAKQAKKKCLASKVLVPALLKYLISQFTH